MSCGAPPRAFSTQGLHLPTATPDVTAHVLLTTADEKITPKRGSIRQPCLTILRLNWKVLAWDLSCGCPQMLAGGAAIIGRLDGAGHARWCMHEADSASCHLGLPRRLPGMGSQCTQTYMIGVFPRAPEGNLMAFCEPAWEVLGQHSHCILLVEMAPGLHQPILKVRGLRSHFSIGGDFPGGSEDKESTCSEEDPSWIPGSGR